METEPEMEEINSGLTSNGRTIRTLSHISLLYFICTRTPQSLFDKSSIISMISKISLLHQRSLTVSKDSSLSSHISQSANDFLISVYKAV